MGYQRELTDLKPINETLNGYSCVSCNLDEQYVRSPGGVLLR